MEILEMKNIVDTTNTAEENPTRLEVLMQDRNLVTTSYDVTAIQNRIFYYCLYSAQKENNGAMCCTLKIDDIKKFIPNKSQRTLTYIKKSLQILKSTELYFEKSEKDENIECNYNLISGIEFNQTTEEFKIYFMQRLYDHIIEYSNYAPLNLDILTTFKSFYSQRLYELMRLWSRTGKTIEKEFTLEYLRFILSVEDKYTKYKNLKQRVLNQAIKEINATGNMHLEMQESKKVGRKVVQVKFIITDNETKTYFKKVNETIVAKPNDISIKYVYLPEKDVFDNESKNMFIDYCYKNSISFKNNNDYINIFNDAIQLVFEKKHIDLIQKSNNSYNLFIAIFKNKLSDLEIAYTKEIENDINLALN